MERNVALWMRPLLLSWTSASESHQRVFNLEEQVWKDVRIQYNTVELLKV